MRNLPVAENFYKRYPYVAPASWVASIQFFIVQLIVALQWPTGYSVKHNTISDLGNTVCELYSERYICSPWYSWMNASFVFLGLGTIIGSLLFYHQFGKNRGSKIGFILMGIGGLGTALVGLFPANVAPPLHGLGAFLPFFVGNISLLFLGHYLAVNSTLKLYTKLSGVFSLLALILFATANYLGLGIGGMERLLAHPQTIWLIVFGLYVSSRTFRNEPLYHPRGKHKA